MMPPKKMSSPGACPTLELKASPRGATTAGRNTKMPHRPYTTLGMAASSSTSIPSGVFSQGGHSSARKTATNRPAGSATTIATSDVISVP